MLRRQPDFFKMLPRRFRNGGITQRDPVQPDDRVHRRADFMAHIGQERRLCLVGLVGLFQRNAQRFALPRQLPHHFLLFGNVYEHADISNRRTVRSAYGFADSPIPAISPVLGQQAILYVIGLLTGIVGDRLSKLLQYVLPVVRMKQVGPGFEGVRKIIRAAISEHSSEFVAPADPDHRARFIKIHCPSTGAEHFMNGVERRRFVLQCDIQRVMFLRLRDVDRHASVLQRPAFRVPRKHAHAAVPPNRAILSAKAELMARCTHDCFIISFGIHIIK